MRRHLGRVTLVALALAGPTGCEEKPRAPALTSEAVFRSDSAGLTFVAPEGWAILARANPPAGMKLDHPLRLVSYQQGSGDKQTSLDLYAVDLPDGQEFPAYLVGHPIGPEKWTAQGPPSATTVKGVKATRYSEAGTGARSEMRRELVEFRRPNRTYVFVVTGKASDSQSRDMARRAIETANWN
jgi:hypothetical protein